MNMRLFGSFLPAFFSAGRNASVAEFVRRSAEINEFQTRALQDLFPLGNVTCGGLTCQNGGTCGVGQDYNSSKALCDCSTALRNTGSSPPYVLKRFVGKSCEIAVDPRDYCIKDNSIFCVNGGQCREQAQNFMNVPCQCPTGYSGRHCEYASVDLPQNCSLNCSGLGSCQHGFNPYGDSGAAQYLPQQNQTQQFMHCVCDTGFAGPNCGYKYMNCGDQDHYCLIGSTCGTGVTGSKVCQCDQGGSTGGQSCEYTATDRCSNPNIIIYPAFSGFLEKNKIDATLGFLPFCANDGICYKVVNTETYYCECSGSWAGPRCQNASSLSGGESPAPAKGNKTANINQVNHDKPANSPKQAPELSPDQAAISSSLQQNGSIMTPGAVFGIVFAVVFTIVVFTSAVFYWLKRAQDGDQHGAAVAHAEKTADTNLTTVSDAEKTADSDRKTFYDVKLEETLSPEAGQTSANEGNIPMVQGVPLKEKEIV